MGRTITTFLLALATMAAAAPAAHAAYLVKPSPGTYLDFLTNVVHDGDGKAVGMGSPLLFSNLDMWTKYEPMLTTAADHNAYADARVNSRWWQEGATSFDVALDPTDTRNLADGDLEAGAWTEPVGSDGVCLYDYCITGEAFLWGGNSILGRPVMEIKWEECSPVCRPATSGPIYGDVYGNHLVFTGGYNTETHLGVVANLCMYVNGVPIQFRCGFTDAFGYGTYIQPYCLLLTGTMTCGSKVAIYTDSSDED